MAETKKEVERAPPLKRPRDDGCSNDDSPESQENSKGDTPSVAVTKRRKNNRDFDKNNRDPTGLVFDQAGSNSPTVAEIRECPTETAELEKVRGSSNYCKLDSCSVTGEPFSDSSNSPVKGVLQTASVPNEAACSSGTTVEGNTHSPGGHDDDEDDSDISEISDLSSSILGVESWRPSAAPIAWVQEQMQEGVDPRYLLSQLISPDTEIPSDFDDITIWKIIINVLSEPPRRHKLKEVNTLDDVIHLLKSSSKIMVLTGAGVSVSCGIPDFRSRDGVYARLAVEYPDLPDPQAMFDIEYFKKNPRPFFKFAKEMYPGQFKPSLSHRFIKSIEDHGKLLRNYTQNIDTLEQVVGLTNIIQCHGSFATATCMSCKHRTDSEAIKDDINNQVIPRCTRCPSTDPMAIMKPDIVFFGESLPREFHHQMEQDKDVCDLIIVVGSSLKVRPVALIPNSLPPSVPQILINREPLRHLTFDVELLGDCDVIIKELCLRLGDDWSASCTSHEPAREVRRDEMSTHTPTPSPPDSASTPDTPNTEQHVDGSNVVGASTEYSGETQTADSTQADAACVDGKVQADSATSTVDTDDTVCSADANVSKDGSSCPSETGAVATAAESPSHPPSLAAGLQDNTFLFLPPNKYIFKGAEVYDNGDRADDDSEDDDDDDSSSADEDSLDAIDGVDNENNGNNRNATNEVTTSVETQQVNSDNNSSSSGSDVNVECTSVDASCSCSADSKETDDASNMSLVLSSTTKKSAQVELCSSTSMDLG